VASQFLEVAVGDVIATPVRDCVKLDAVRELHVFLFGKPLELAEPLVPFPGILAGASVVTRSIPRAFRKILKLERKVGVVRRSQTQDINNLVRRGSVLGQPSRITMSLCWPRSGRRSPFVREIRRLYRSVDTRSHQIAVRNIGQNRRGGRIIRYSSIA
jgi:hypothetical protein